MKKFIVLLSLAACLSACVTDANGNKHYAGPSLRLTLGYNGATVGVNILGDPNLSSIVASNTTGKTVVQVSDPKTIKTPAK